MGSDWQRISLEHAVLYKVLAVDYDGTLATNGVVDDGTVDALIRLRQSGRRVVLVTGRLLEPLLAAFPQVGLCDSVVAENGALLYDPDTRTERPLVDAPPREFIEKLTERGVPVSEVGRVVIVTRIPYETEVLETIRDMSLELHIIFNKGAVMVLPTGVNKASGLRAALQELGLSQHNAFGIGDAENDGAFLKLCGASAAVANALDSLKKQVDLVSSGVGSAGVVEVIERLIGDDLQALHERPERAVLLGHEIGGGEVRIPVYGTRVLVTGDSAGGKSKLAVGLIEQLIEHEYQTVVIDPEGDYQSVEGPLVLGTLERVPTTEEVMQVVGKSGKSCVVSYFGAKTGEQPPLFSKMYRALQDHRVHTGKPHWHIIDEAHYPISGSWKPIDDLHLEDLGSVMYTTAFPEQMPRKVLDAVDLLVAISNEPAKLLERFCGLLGEKTPKLKPSPDAAEHRAIAWWRRKDSPFWFRRLEPRGEHQRHVHKYFDGQMEPADCFYFRGPSAALNLAAGNLRTFMQLAEGVDLATWGYHLKRGDYARWFRDKIQDQTLADAAEQLEHQNVSPKDSRDQMLEMIQKTYVIAT
jgi:hydroxymethylpyrimidine pyrophosphatase-like HAD family hydrolase